MMDTPNSWFASAGFGVPVQNRIERRRNERHTIENCHATFIVKDERSGKVTRFRKDVVNMSQGGICIKTHAFPIRVTKEQKYHIAVDLIFTDKIVKLHHFIAYPAWVDKTKGVSGFTLLPATPEKH